MSLCVRGARLDGERVSLRAENGRVVALGADVASAPVDDVVDASDKALVPGLVNGHTHAAMTLFRGWGDDLPLMEWLNTRIWPAEARLTSDDVYWGTRLACLEMIRTGTVRFWDMYWHPAAAARAVGDAGLQATLAMPIIDGLDASRSARARAETERSLEELADAGDHARPSLGPHAIYTVSERSLEWVAELARERRLPVHIHLSETLDEVNGCVRAHGVRPAAYLERFGLLTPDTVLAHGVWLDDEELALVGERGSTIVTNPVSNLKLAVGGVFQYPKARARGVPVGLGTDGAASNNSLDLLADVKVLALLQKHVAGDPAAMPAPEAWSVATGQRAPRLGQTGRIEVNGPADFLLVRADAPELTPGDVTANLVYAASGSVVDTTVIAGRVVMRGGVVDGEEEVRAHVMECARRLGVTPSA